MLAGLPLTLEFSGALVAPAPAVLRAKTAGALVELGGCRRQPGSHQPGAWPHRSLRCRQPRRRARRGGGVGTRPVPAGRARAGLQPAPGRPAVHLAQRARCLALRARRRARRAGRRAGYQLTTARTARRDDTLLAPIGGLVSKRHALPGEAGRRAAGADPGRPRPARTRRQRRHARGGAPRAGTEGAGARRRGWKRRSTAPSTASHRPPSPARAPSASPSSCPTARRSCAPASSPWPPWCCRRYAAPHAAAGRRCRAGRRRAGLGDRGAARWRAAR